MIWINFHRDKYEHEVDPLDNGEWYWKLYYTGQRINGGIAKTKFEGEQLALQYRAQHQQGQFHNQYVWDHETKQWISRSDIEALRGR